MKPINFLFLVIIFIIGLCNITFVLNKSYEIRISFEKSLEDVLYLAIDNDYTQFRPGYTVIDSAFVTGEDIVFKGKLDYPTGGRLFFKNNNGLYVFVFLNDIYQLVMNTDEMWKTKIINPRPKIFTEIEKYKNSREPLQNKMNQTYENSINADEIGDDSLADYNSELNKSFVKEIDQLTTNFIKNHSDSFISLLMFREFIGLKLLEKRKVFSYLNERNKSHPLGQRLYFELFQKDSLTAEGNSAISFFLKDSNDIFYELDDFKGKYLLMFFWATWCDNCINQFVQYRELLYKSQGKPFEIVSVSIEYEQQVWLNFLETHDLPWINVFDEKDEKGWRLFEYYDNQAIPFNVLIGKRGEIVKLNISFKELEEILDDN